jgi:hypothetical protein
MLISGKYKLPLTLLIQSVGATSFQEMIFFASLVAIGDEHDDKKFRQHKPTTKLFILQINYTYIHYFNEISLF